MVNKKKYSNGEMELLKKINNKNNGVFCGADKILHKTKLLLDIKNSNSYFIIF